MDRTEIVDCRAFRKALFPANQRKEKKYATNCLQPAKRQAGNN
jgi:hypothetical protein